MAPNGYVDQEGKYYLELNLREMASSGIYQFVCLSGIKVVTGKLVMQL